MNKEIKRQLILSGILLCLIVTTLFLWYDNFMFHTYVHVIDYQYCFAGENEALRVDGYEFYKNEHVQMNGRARIMALQDRFFLKNDIVKTAFVISSDKEEYRFEQETKINSDNEVFTLDEKETKEQLYEDDFDNVVLHMTILRDNKTVYDKDINITKQNMVVYNGGSKNYTIRNVYVTPTWLKTGDFSSTVKDIEDEYSYITIDYLCLKVNGNEEDINDYERFAYIKGKTSDVLKNQHATIAYNDEKGSLLERTLSCVVTLTTDDPEAKPFTFIIPLHGTIKAVEAHD